MCRIDNCLTFGSIAPQYSILKQDGRRFYAYACSVLLVLWASLRSCENQAYVVLKSSYYDVFLPFLCNVLFIFSSGS